MVVVNFKRMRDRSIPASEAVRLKTCLNCTLWCLELPTRKTLVIEGKENFNASGKFV